MAREEDMGSPEGLVLQSGAIPEALITQNVNPTKVFGQGKMALLDAVQAAFSDAMDYKGKLPAWILDMEGMSGRKYRYFINNLVNYANNPRYLEVGSWAGSTLCSAICMNKLTATAIDNWSLFGGPVNAFFSNVSQACSLDTKLSIITNDFRNINFAALGKFNIYLFDGPHEAKDQYDGLANALECMDHEFVYVVDDWNWEGVRAGTMTAIADLELVVMSSIEVRTTMDNSHSKIYDQKSDWHNGYYISVLRKHFP